MSRCIIIVTGDRSRCQARAAPNERRMFTFRVESSRASRTRLRSDRHHSCAADRARRTKAIRGFFEEIAVCAAATAACAARIHACAVKIQGGAATGKGLAVDLLVCSERMLLRAARIGTRTVRMKGRIDRFPRHTANCLARADRSDRYAANVASGTGTINPCTGTTHRCPER